MFQQLANNEIDCISFRHMPHLQIATSSQILSGFQLEFYTLRIILHHNFAERLRNFR